ncbi:MAG: hypothetical protein JO053_08010 [Acidobacteria bacterium]|nr:hypothetical protein [Acidobacteriota bacterium]
MRSVSYPVSLLFLAVLFGGDAFGQRRLDTTNTVRLDPQKPSIYLEFVKTGDCSYAPTFTVLSGKPCESTRNDNELQRFKAVWLRLVNNTRWAIVVDGKNMFGSPTVGPLKLADKRIVTAVTDGAEIDVQYGVEAETGCDFHKEGPNGERCLQITKVAPKVPSLGVFTPIYVPSGRSTIFAVNLEHLSEYLLVYVPFHYEWETNDKAPSLGDPKHRVYYSDWKRQQRLK